MRKIPLSKLEEGMRVARLDRQGVHFPFYGQALYNLEIIDELKKQGIEHVYVYLSNKDDDSESKITVTPEIETSRPPCRSTLIEFDGEASRPGVFSPGGNLLFAQKIRTRAQNTVRSLFNSFINGRHPDFDSLKLITSEFVSTCLYQNEVFMNMLVVKEVTECEVNHAINVSILAIALGRRLGLPSTELENLGTAGLLHDIGMLSLQKAIYKHTNELSENELRLLKTHPERSHELLKKYSNMNQSILSAVLHHHERANGTGYPHGIYENQISINAKILAIVDQYDSMITERPYSHSQSPVAAIKQIYGWAGQHFNETIVKFFVSMLGVYPVGTIVRLESGETGIVYKTTRGNSDKPKVLLITDSTGNDIEPTALDLNIKDSHGIYLKSINKSLTPNQITTDILSILEKHIFAPKA